MSAPENIWWNPFANIGFLEQQEFNAASYIRQDIHKAAIAERDATIAELRAALNEAAWAIQYGKHLHPKTLADKWSAIAEGKPK